MTGEVAPAASRLGVVVVNFRSADLLEACLASVLSEPVDQVVIVDNASGGDELAALRRLVASDARVRLVESEVNSGFGAGVNLGVSFLELTGPDLIWILNPDTVVRAGAATVMGRRLRGAGTGIASAVLTTGPPGGEKVWFAGGDVDLRAGTVHHRVDAEAEENDGEERVNTFLSGACMMVSAATWHQLGGFDEGLFMYWEDVDLCVRATQAGVPLVLCTEARVWHREGGSSTRDVGRSALYYEYTARNRIVVCARHRSLGQLFVGPGLAKTIAMLVAPLVRERAGRWRKGRAVLRGIRGGSRVARDLRP